jgi:hypothetical protein
LAVLNNGLSRFAWLNFVARLLALPIHYFSLSSGRPPTDVVNRMTGQFAPGQGSGRLSAGSPHFVAKVRGDRFRLVSVIRGMNTYAPRISGRIRPTASGCVVEGWMTLHPVALLVLLGFILVPQYFALGSTGSVDVAWLLIVAAFHLVMYYAGFRPEVRRAEAWIREVAADRSSTTEEPRVVGAVRGRT